MNIIKATKELTAVLIDDDGEIIKTISDGVKDGLIVVTNSAVHFVKIVSDMFKK